MAEVQEREEKKVSLEVPYEHLLLPSIEALKEHIPHDWVPDYLLPLLILKRYSDIFKEEVAHLIQGFQGLYGKGAEGAVEAFIRVHREELLFYVHPVAYWEAVRAQNPMRLGKYLEDALLYLRISHEDLERVLRRPDYTFTLYKGGFEHGRALLGLRLAQVLGYLDGIPLGLSAPPDILTLYYRYLLERVGAEAPKPYKSPWPELEAIADRAREVARKVRGQGGPKGAGA